MRLLACEGNLKSLRSNMMDLVSMWPVLLAGGAGSLGVAAVWWYGRSHRSGTAYPKAASHQGENSSRPRSSSRPASYDSLDTVADWEPSSTRVLTHAERDAYQILRKALPDHMILAQVPVSRFIKVPTRNSYVEWMRRVGSLCVDLVVCDAASHVLAVVEVRLPAVKEKERTLRRHARMDKVFKAAHIPVHVWLEDALPSVASARESILGQVAGRPGSAPQSAEVVLARRDAEAAAVVAAMRTGGIMQGMTVKERSVDFNLNELDSSSDEQDEGNSHRDPPPSTWFDDLEPTMPAPLDEAPHRR